MDTTKHSEGVNPHEIESVEALLGELDLSSVETDEEILSEMNIETTTDAELLTDADVVAVEVAIAKAASYEDAEVTTTEIVAPSAAETETVAEPAKKVRAKKAAKTVAAPRAKSLEELPDATFNLDTRSLVTTGDMAKANVIALRPTQKKIAEKFDNLFMAIAAGKKPSIYTMICFQTLEAKGTVTQGDLVAALSTALSSKGTGYDIGTARSQAGQIMNLFNAVQIATRTGQMLIKNDNSAIAAKLRA